MKYLNITPVFLLFTLCSLVFAQVGEAPKPETPQEKYVSTVLTPAGVRILKIDYPCDVHPTASVEVRILDKKTGERPDLTNPVFLQSRWLERKDLMNHRLKDAIELCYLEDDDDMILKSLNFDNPEATMDVLGWIGAFGVRDVVIRAKMKNPQTDEEETTLIFPHASRTAVGKMPTRTDPYSTKSFGFDLIGPEFEQPCMILVWVMRGEKILLQETLHWDGHMEKPHEESAIEIIHDVDPNKKKEDFYDDGDDDDDDDDDDGEEETGDDDEEEEEEASDKNSGDDEDEDEEEEEE